MRIWRNDEKCLHFLSGHCTEFNVDGGVIQIHIPNPCGKERFPSCFETYKSSEAYKCKTAYLSNFILFILYMSILDVFFSFMYNIINVYIHFHCLLFIIINILVFFNETLLIVIYKKYISDQGCYELVYGKKGINSTSIPTNKPSTSYKPENE